MRIIVNAAMIPNDGDYSYRSIVADAAAAWLTEHGRSAKSYVGYPQTAEHIAVLSGVQVALNRAKCIMDQGDEALVVKLTYRVVDPATKGQPQPEDWQYAILRRTDGISQPTRLVAPVNLTAGFFGSPRDDERDW